MKIIKWSKKLGLSLTAFAMAAVMATSFDFCSITALAESQAKVTASSAKIRKDANSTSDTIGSATKDTKISIVGQLTGTDGYTWYQVFVDAQTKGYIRSDLVEITDGSTPAKVTATTSSTTTTTTTTTTETPAQNVAPADVVKVNPVSAKVTGGSKIRVRDNASTSSNVVTTVDAGFVLTVVGTAKGSDGKDWYQVEFMNNNQQTTGFVRSDYAELSGELSEYTEAEPVVDIIEGDSEYIPQEEIVNKDWETQYEDGIWYLVDNKNACRYKLQETLDAVDYNRVQYEKEYKKAKAETLVIVILAALAVVLLLCMAIIYLKLKELRDDKEFEEIAKDAQKNRPKQPTAARPQGQPGQRPQGQSRPRPQGQPGQRPQGQPGPRPQGQPGPRPQGQPGPRPQGQPGQRPQGQPMPRPQGQPVQNPQAARPVQNVQATPVQPQQVPRPQSAPRPQPVMEPAQASINRRPAPVAEEFAPVHQESVKRSPEQPARPQANQAPVRTIRATGNVPNPTSKPRNFASDDDEFEFEFLNWDGEE